MNTQVGPISHKESDMTEQLTHTCYNMDQPQKHDAKFKKPDKKMSQDMFPYLWKKWLG